MLHNIWSDVVYVFTLENELIGTSHDACLKSKKQIISVNLSLSLNRCYHSEALDVHKTKSFQHCRKSMVCNTVHTPPLIHFLNYSVFGLLVYTVVLCLGICIHF